MIGKALRYYRTLKYLKPRQTVGRAFAAAKARINPKPRVEVPEGLAGRRPFRVEPIEHAPTNVAEDIREGIFRFLNREERLGFPPDWRAAKTPLLWRFNLHYHHYLALLPEEEARALRADWIANNPYGEGAAWHPYPLSLRITAWAKRGATGAEAESLYRQAAFLFRRLEFYHPANHYLENARALVLAGRFFGGAGESGKWLAKGIDILKRETPEHVFRDGAYFERSPTYHALMFELILDVLNASPEDDENSSFLAPLAERMARFLRAATHPGGGPALVNDSSLEIAPPADRLLDYARRLGVPTPDPFKNGLATFPDAGFFAYSDENYYLLIKGGAIGPDHIPAHAHADVFSFELSYRGARFAIDAGVGEYQAGEIRTHARSSRAHNVCEIDGVDHAECWGGFRVARRYAPREVAFERSGDAIVFRGTFDGYSKLIGDGITWRRTLTLDPMAGALTVRDEIDGRGDHEATTRLRLHPAFAASEIEGGFEATDGERRTVILAEDATLESARYFPEFGVEREARAVAVSRSGLPTALKYRVRFGERD
jgi:uncharacterized heparinase superfamily protein